MYGIGILRELLPAKLRRECVCVCVEYSPVQARSDLLERWNLAVAVLLGYGMRSKFPGERAGFMYPSMEKVVVLGFFFRV